MVVPVAGYRSADHTAYQLNDPDISERLAYRKFGCGVIESLHVEKPST